MPKKLETKIHRVIDANFNRAREGSRVCEDICRFVYDEGALTRQMKNVRHDLTGLMKSIGWKEAAAARDTAADVGKGSTAREMKRKTVEDVLFANLQRVKESVRVLEETAKLFSRKTAEDFKKLRYRIYRTERSLLKKF